ncbi:MULTISPECIES: hypothetical protein [Pseudomonas]|mgnify:FL=1|uniref:hypothetical protein n=1 Tax=Pseudomonas TaxID=286 RepID=UPI000693961A|nr:MULTISPECIES: hypothetical protein [Pseudomonas]AMT88856.1 hypothetical protein AYO71_15390 [Pseudomonas koreensis]MBB4055156.1 hypothetical protein [Pseudomonas koreensis]TSB48779.1 hypothetical protein FEE99_28400 [Pseudomonas sp. ef1]
MFLENNRSRSLRILIADSDVRRGQSIEQQFNKLGCLSVLNVCTYRDLRILTYYCPQRLSLVVVNAELLSEMAMDPLDFFGENPLIRHLLIFNPNDDHQWSKTFFNPHPQRWMRLVSKINLPRLADFLMLADPALKEIAEPASTKSTLSPCANR